MQLVLNVSDFIRENKRALMYIYVQSIPEKPCFCFCFILHIF